MPRFDVQLNYIFKLKKQLINKYKSTERVAMIISDND